MIVEMIMKVKIIKENAYYKIITNRLNPLYIFITFEFVDQNNGVYRNYLDQELKILKIELNIILKLLII